ncbi:hypothetical protein Tco_0043284, partial [Tanacetum coccineum]
WAKEFHQDRASLVKVPVENFTLQSSVQLLQEKTDSVRSNQRISLTAPSVPLKLIAFAIIAACASRATMLQMLMSFWEAFYQHKTTRNKNDITILSLKFISNPEASQSNLAIISPLLSLMFSNWSTRLSEFSFQMVKILLYDHPTIFESFYFVFYVLNAIERESSSR